MPSFNASIRLSSALPPDLLLGSSNLSTLLLIYSQPLLYPCPNHPSLASKASNNDGVITLDSLHPCHSQRKAQHLNFSLPSFSPVHHYLVLYCAQWYVHMHMDIYWFVEYTFTDNLDYVDSLWTWNSFTISACMLQLFLNHIQGPNSCTAVPTSCVS